VLLPNEQIFAQELNKFPHRIFPFLVPSTKAEIPASPATILGSFPNSELLSKSEWQRGRGQGVYLILGPR